MPRASDTYTANSLSRTISNMSSPVQQEVDNSKARMPELKYQVGSRIRKKFGRKWYKGEIASVKLVPVYKINYNDGDWEEIEESDMAKQVQILEHPAGKERNEELLLPESSQEQQASFPSRKKRRKKRDKKNEEDGDDATAAATAQASACKSENVMDEEERVAFKKEEVISMNSEGLSTNSIVTPPVVKKEEVVVQELPVSSNAPPVQLGHDYLVQTWRDRLPSAQDDDANFPKKFCEVLQLMDELAEDDLDMRPVQTFNFEEEMYSHKRHGTRPGMKTHDKLRDRQKNGDSRLNWHKHRGEWCPPGKDQLADFIEVLLEIAGEFVF